MDNTLDPKTLKPSLADARKWAEAVAASDLLPFSFQYGGHSSAELLPDWKVSRTNRTKAGVTTRELTWRDPATRLECVLEMQTFAKFAAVEWVMRFRNTGKKDTPLIENIRPLDVEWAPDKDQSWHKDETLLRRSCGSQQKPTDFLYQVDPLPPGSTIAMAAGGGRPSNDWLPFFNLQTGKTGVVIGIGWSGQWAAEFARPADATIRIRAGQELTRLTLHPGEEIRTPLIALLFWQGNDVVEAQNLWRRWYRAHNLPRVGGKPQPAVTQIQVFGREKDISYVQKFLDAGIHADLCWRDAGGSRADVWFQAGDGPFNEPGMIWLNSGTWEVRLAISLRRLQGGCRTRRPRLAPAQAYPERLQRVNDMFTGRCA